MKLSRLGPLTAIMIALCVRYVPAQSAPQSEVRVGVAQISAVAGGVYAHTADNWSLLMMRLENRLEQPITLECATYFDVEPTLQYGRRFWLPGRSRLRMSYPIRIPSISDADQQQLGIHTVVSKLGESQKTLISHDVGRLQLADTLQIVRRPMVTGIISPLDEPIVPSDTSIQPIDLTVTAQIDLGFPRGVTTLGDRLLPATGEGLRAFDQLVIADDRMLGDAASLSAIRHWLFDGGRLWIMLDRVNPILIDALLGDSSGCQVVDTVTLTSIEISAGPDGGHIESSSAEYEQPVKLVRVLWDQATVPFVVNGWPAALETDVGAGRLIVTTLESTAWVSRESERTRTNQRGELTTGYRPIPAFKELMQSVFVSRPKTRETAEALKTDVPEYIGYSTPSRPLVTNLLCGFVVVLFLSGVLLARGGHREQLAIIGPALATVTAGVLIVIGRREQQAVPPTAALLQIVHAIPGTDDVLIEGTAGLYAQDSGTMVLNGHKGGWILPDLRGTEGTTKRLIWSDLDDWGWENVPQSPGLRTAEFQVPVQHTQRIEARASFNSKGIGGQLSLPNAMHAEDVVLGTEAGRIGVEFQKDLKFTAGADRVLGSDQYIQADLLTDEQVRRSQVLASVLNQVEAGWGREPTLYFWTAPWDAGLEFAQETHSAGDALVAVPLDLRRPATGTEVRLPSPLLPYRGTIGVDGLHPSGLYDHRRNMWTERSRPSSIWLRFQVPEVLLPIELTTMHIVVRVTGPIGKLDLSVEQNGRVIPVKSWLDPVGTLELILREPNLPEVTDDGGLLVRVDAGDPNRPQLTNPDPEGSGKVSYWKIESLEMEARAVVLE